MWSHPSRTADSLSRRASGFAEAGRARRSSYAYALLSIAAVVQTDGTGCVAVGGVAHKPWRVEAAEAEMPRGAKAVMAKVFAGARPTPDNEFNLRLAERTLGAVFIEARG